MTDLTKAELDAIIEAHAEHWRYKGNDRAEAEIEKIGALARAALSPWREIESVPRCERVLAYAPGYLDTWAFFDGPEQPFTHWMPLPQPPSNGERDDEDFERALEEAERRGPNEALKQLMASPPPTPTRGGCICPEDVVSDGFHQDCPIHGYAQPAPQPDAIEDAGASGAKLGYGQGEGGATPSPAPTAPADVEGLVADLNARDEQLYDQTKCGAKDHILIAKAAAALRAIARERDEAERRLKIVDLWEWHHELQDLTKQKQVLNEKLASEQRCHARTQLDLTEQNRKLREALEKIAQDGMGYANSIARAALKE